MTDPGDTTAADDETAAAQPSPLPEPSAAAAVKPFDTGCGVNGVVDRGWSGGLHYWEIYGDFRCGHSESFPSLITSTSFSPSQSCYNNRSVTTTYTSSFQINVAMGTTWVSSCILGVSSWNQPAGDIQFGN